jgi:hypothetical protein
MRPAKVLTQDALQDQKMKKIIAANQDVVKVNFQNLENKLTKMGKNVRDLEETTRYVVKVADSCPLAIEQQRL